MKTEQEHVCPYAGLRSFTEEESLYFKGRDSQIQQISDLLEQNKFLMVTGASGEGKSSLIYAGLVPSMRAGFFRSQYSNWVVADFRPERSPLQNMSTALADVLKIDQHTVATELARGYSSLIDLYLNSQFYLDENDSRWSSKSPAEKNELKRNAANLVVIIDQFEEFFTNPENFTNEAPTSQSQTVVNLALETARIAIKRNLPVYVVFTMRSDFIGQCTSFRGLPEHIGFSQFFVPRLKRKDFKQVIEEPAILSGNRISQRLIERLVYDIAEGVDQLPVLQHALSQIWLVADRGKQEMDLIHYAMVGGMPAEELPDNDHGNFNQWLKTLPEFKQQFYKETGLQKIIEVHANTLYEGAWSSLHNRHPDRKLTISQCKRAVALTFICLTKIDNSRAVRNRMTLREIHGIINDPAIDLDNLNELLSEFRDEANSFIRPYKTDAPATHILAADSVLDITHEALIRNWARLNRWANKEFEYYKTWLDFKKQLSRWKESGRNSGYLLPIGPLTYFENWYKNAKPNAAWIGRYLEVPDADTANELLVDAKSFLKRSARKAIVSRTFMKYGTSKVITFLSIVIMFVLSGFYWIDAEQKQNLSVVKQITQKAAELIQSEEVSSNEKGNFLLVRERMEPGTLIPVLQNMPPRNSIVVGKDVYTAMLTMDPHFSNPIKSELVEFLKGALTEYSRIGADDAFLLKQANYFITMLAYDHYFNPSDEGKRQVHETTTLLKEVVLRFYRDTGKFNPAVPTELNFALQYWLALGNPSPEDVQQVLAAISPFMKKEKTFEVYYPKNAYEFNGTRALSYNGGYHMLASLYAATGDEKKVIACFEQLKELGDYFFTGGNTSRLFNNYNSVLGFMYQFDHEDRVKPVINWIGKNFPVGTPQAIYKNMMNRSGYIFRFYDVNYLRASRSMLGYISPNLFFGSWKQVRKIAADYEAVLKQLPDPAEKNFLLAMHFKRLAMFEHKYLFDSRQPADTAKLNTLLAKACAHFEAVPVDYRDKIATPLVLPYWSDGVRQPRISNGNLFTYPDYMDGWFSRTYHTDLFYLYQLKKGLLDKYFNAEKDRFYLQFWLAKAYEVDPEQETTAQNPYPLSDSTLASLGNFLTRKASDATLPYIMVANRYFEKSQVDQAMKYYNKIPFAQIGIGLNRFDYLERTFFSNQLKDLSRNLAGAGKMAESEFITSQFKFDRERAFSYIFNAERLFMAKQDPHAFVCLDSALSLLSREDFNLFDRALDYRFKLITVLSQIGGEDLGSMANHILEDFIEINKFDGILAKIRGAAFEGTYYHAMATMPATLTESQKLRCIYYLLWQVARARDGGGKWTAMDKAFEREQEYIYYVPF
jgi:hypothetical protein